MLSDRSRQPGQVGGVAGAAGPTSAISRAFAAGTRTDLSSELKQTQASGASPPVNGIDAESPLECAVALRAFPFPTGYSLTFSTVDELATADHLAVGEIIDRANPISVYGYTTQLTACLDAPVTDNVFGQLKSADLEWMFGQFSSTSPHAVTSLYARAFTVHFEASNTVITLKFKQEPGVIGEQLTENEAQALKNESANVFVFYSNDLAIIQEGAMANGYFIDEVQGCDWQPNQIRTDVFTVLYTAAAKIPQTDAGTHIRTTAVEAALDQGVTNGLIAPGLWNAPGFRKFNQDDLTPKDYYVFCPLIATQSRVIRKQRISPTIKCAMKLVGAIHKANVVVNTNR